MLKAIALGILKKAGEALIGVIVNRVLTKDLFAAAAVDAVEAIARWLVRLTDNDLDDRFVETELVPRLRAKPKGEGDESG